MLEETRKWMGQVLELLLWLVAVLVLIQILFGSDATAFFGFDVISNLGVLVAKFGNAGLVGIIAAAIVAYYIVKNRDGSRSVGGSSVQTPQPPQPPQPQQPQQPSDRNF